MGFRGREFAFESPAAAVAGLVARLTGASGHHAGSDAAGTSEAATLSSARGRILAETIVCDRDSPAFDHAAMDGYAVRAADVRAAATRARQAGETERGATITLAVIGESRIGAPPPELARSSDESTPHAVAFRIATGAPIPCGAHGADAVIKREDVAEHVGEGNSAENGVSSVTLALDTADRIAAGDHVRRRGENSQAGGLVLVPGVVLSAAALGALAAVGCVTPRVRTGLRVALITTGEELVAAHEVPGPFQVRDSNASAVGGALASQVWLEVVYEAHQPDDADLAAALRNVIEPPICAEAVVLTGGVSMGHRDPVLAAVESVGAEVILHGLPQRPGKPMLAASLTSRSGAAVPIFGLPGNPVSAMVTCTRIVLPVLARCAGVGQTPAALLPRLLELEGDDGKRIGLWWHRPVTLRTREDDVTAAQLVDTRGSGDVVSVARSDGFVELPPARTASARGGPNSLVHFYPWPA